MMREQIANGDGSTKMAAFRSSADWAVHLQKKKVKFIAQSRSQSFLHEKTRTLKSYATEINVLHDLSA
jgi:hypothetical protein